MDKKNDPRKSCLLKLGEDESNVSIREKKKGFSYMRWQKNHFIYKYIFAQKVLMDISV